LVPVEAANSGQQRRPPIRQAGAPDAGPGSLALMGAALPDPASFGVGSSGAVPPGVGEPASLT